MGFIWSAGLLALFRVELDLFSLFAAVTFVGIAVDYGIYVLYRYVFERPRDMNDVMTRTGAAIIIACGTALIGFGTLINSSYRPLHVFGIVSIVTLSCCLVASWSPCRHSSSRRSDGHRLRADRGLQREADVGDVVRGTAPHVSTVVVVDDGSTDETAAGRVKPAPS